MGPWGGSMPASCDLETANTMGWILPLLTVLRGLEQAQNVPRELK